MDRRSSLDRIVAYHERTKHHPGRFARSLGHLDWATQPDPFRTYDGAQAIRLEEVPPAEAPTFDELYAPARLSARPIDGRSVSQLFYDSLALSAWKSYGGQRWSLRCNPSSGNLHPTEGYLIAGPVPGLLERPGVFHYSPLEHALERRAVLSLETWSALLEGLPAESLLVGLSSIHWREAWKYGERAYRYCQHDVGHAVAAIAMAAAALGWQAQLLGGASDSQCATLLGIVGERGPEAEHPDVLILVTPVGTRDRGELAALAAWQPSVAATAAVAASELCGTPNVLSPHHHPWPAIDEVAAVAAFPGPTKDEPAFSPTGSDPPRPRAWEPAPPAAVGPSGRAILRQRRSAVEMDGSTSIDRSTFYRMLARLMPSADAPPLASLPWRPAVDLLLFVHRVRGLERGLYLLVRDEGRVERLQAALDSEFVWALVPDRPEGLALHLLEEGDVRLAARRLSCDQAIASDGAFAVAMLAEFEPRLHDHGAWFYRRLFWETGAIGQVLYLEAEAAGVRGTGIGCFFDDVVHEVLGLKDRSFQSLYHFTVGGPVLDPRLRTFPGYAHREDDAEGGTPPTALRDTAG